MPQRQQLTNPRNPPQNPPKATSLLQVVGDRAHIQHMDIASTEFTEFPKIARLARRVLVTEKIDGTNAQICITDEGEFLVGSRSRWLTKETDNFGFYKWALENEEELRKLGPGRHFGEWWGQGIQRGYGLKEKRFSLFNVARWAEVGTGEARKEYAPACCHVVPCLLDGLFDTAEIDRRLRLLAVNGSYAAPGFMKPEGVVIFHVAGNVGFKKTIEKDEGPKGVMRWVESAYRRNL